MKNVGVVLLTIVLSVCTLLFLVYSYHQADQKHQVQVFYASLIMDEYDQLQAKISQTAEGTREHTEALKNYSDLLSRIGDNIPELITGYDALNEQLEINEQKLRELSNEGKAKP